MERTSSADGPPSEEWPFSAGVQTQPPTSFDLLSLVLRILRGASAVDSAKRMRLCKAVVKLCLSSHPRASATSDSSLGWPELPLKDFAAGLLQTLCQDRKLPTQAAPLFGRATAFVLGQQAGSLGSTAKRIGHLFDGIHRYLELFSAISTELERQRGDGETRTGSGAIAPLVLTFEDFISVAHLRRASSRESDDQELTERREVSLRHSFEQIDHDGDGIVHFDAAAHWLLHSEELMDDMLGSAPDGNALMPTVEQGTEEVGELLNWRRSQKAPPPKRGTPTPSQPRTPPRLRNRPSQPVLRQERQRLGAQQQVISQYEQKRGHVQQRLQLQEARLLRIQRGQREQERKLLQQQQRLQREAHQLQQRMAQQEERENLQRQQQEWLLQKEKQQQQMEQQHEQQQREQQLPRQQLQWQLTAQSTQQPPQQPQPRPPPPPPQQQQYFDPRAMLPPPLLPQKQATLQPAPPQLQVQPPQPQPQPQPLVESAAPPSSGAGNALAVAGRSPPPLPSAPSEPPAADDDDTKKGLSTAKPSTSQAPHGSGAREPADGSPADANAWRGEETTPAKGPGRSWSAAGFFGSLDLATIVCRTMLGGCPASGLVWSAVGNARPRIGVEIRHPGLSTVLCEKAEFTQSEWMAFGVAEELRMDHYVRSGELYYAPAQASGVSELDYLRGLSGQEVQTRLTGDTAQPFHTAMADTIVEALSALSAAEAISGRDLHDRFKGAADFSLACNGRHTGIESWDASSTATRSYGHGASARACPHATAAPSSLLSHHRFGCVPPSLHVLCNSFPFSRASDADLSKFYAGLVGLIGPPEPKIRSTMHREHCCSADSSAPFSTTNYHMETTPRIVRGHARARACHAQFAQLRLVPRITLLRACYHRPLNGTGLVPSLSIPQEWWFVADPEGGLVDNQAGLHDLGLTDYPAEAARSIAASHQRRPKSLSHFASTITDINGRLHADGSPGIIEEEVIGIRL